MNLSIAVIALLGFILVCLLVRAAVQTQTKKDIAPLRDDYEW